MMDKEMILASLLKFLKNGHSIKTDKDKIASLLAMSPEALTAFEQAYATQVLNSDVLSANFFEINSRQAAAAHKGIDNPDDPYLKDIKFRIVNELIAKALVWKFDGKTVSVCNDLPFTASSVVTNEEINALPPQLRPQLTGNLM